MAIPTNPNVVPKSAQGILHALQAVYRSGNFYIPERKHRQRFEAAACLGLVERYSNGWRFTTLGEKAYEQATNRGIT